jgi:hypothetical protein
LALVTHLADDGVGPIPETALRKAIAFVSYLETHARRAYASAANVETSAAKAILAKIRAGDLQDGFSAREVYKAGWAHLSDREAAQAGLDLLCDLDWLAARKISPKGRRPAPRFSINPRGVN